MNSFLGVPIKVRDEAYGNLYLTDKEGWSEFTSDDQALVEVFALAAGIAIENRSLNDRTDEGVTFPTSALPPLAASGPRRYAEWVEASAPSDARIDPSRRGSGID